MRYAIDCFHATVPGGIRTYLENLVRELGRESPDDEFVLLYRLRPSDPSPSPLPHSPPRSRLVCRRAPRRFSSYLENTFDYPRIERWTGKIDVFHGTHFWLPPSRARAVLTVHDVTYLRHPESSYAQKLNHYGYRYLLRHGLARADRVLAISHSTRRDLIELCGVPEEKIWVVPFGADLRFRPLSVPEREAFRGRLGIDREFVLFPAGTLDRRKNLERTLRAFREAFPHPDDRPLMFVCGVGTLPQNLHALADSLGLAADLRVESVAYPEDLIGLMSTARWGGYLSLYEGFGLPLLEGMACGLPLIVSDRSSIPEVVGDAALRVDPESLEEIAQGMLEIHRGSSLRDELSERGKARASSAAFSWARAARQTLAAYRDDPADYARESQPLNPSPALV